MVKIVLVVPIPSEEAAAVAEEVETRLVVVAPVAPDEGDFVVTHCGQAGCNQSRIDWTWVCLNFGNPT